MRKQLSHNRHHLLHSRVSYESSRTTKALREQESLIFRMPIDAHDELHAQTPPVALIGHYAALGVLGRYNPTFNPTRDIDNLCLAIDKSTRGPQFHQLERDLAGLAIEGVQLQKPYILEALSI